MLEFILFIAGCVVGFMLCWALGCVSKAKPVKPIPPPGKAYVWMSLNQYGDYEQLRVMREQAIREMEDRLHRNTNGMESYKSDQEAIEAFCELYDAYPVDTH